MKNIKIIITLVFTILIGLSLASCKSNDDVKAEIVDVVGLRTTASVTVKIADDKMLVTQGTFCASIYKEDNSLVGTVTFTETNYNNQTKDFADLEKDTTYIVKLYATYNGKKHTMDKATVKTISKGTQDDPTLINTVEDFNNIKKDPAGHFKLNADLDFNQAVISTLFTDTTPFKGTINGNNKTIKNFKLETPSTHNGIFGYLATNSTIQDLIIDNVTMTITRSTDAYIGILAGTNKGTVKNVTLKNSQVNINSNGSGTLTIGTLIGTNSDSGKIEDSKVEASKMTVSARNKTYIGGLVGTNLLPTSGSTKSKISNSTADVEINVTQSLTTTYEVEICVGGFIGVNQTIVENSISQSKIKVSTDKLNTTDTVKYFVSVGGFVGTLNSTALINGCAVITDLDYSSKNVEIASIGGISGKIFGNSKVTNSLIIANGSKLVSNITTTLPEDSTKTLELVASEVVASTETNKYVTAYVLGNLTTDFSSVNNVIASNNITDISTLQLSANVLTFVNSKK